MAKNTLSSGANTYNYVRAGMSSASKEIMPIATNDNIVQIGTIMLNDQYQPMLNEFIHGLVNRIALTIIENKSTYNNPLARFKKGSVPLGTDIQELYTNPAQGEDYVFDNNAMAKLLAITDPDTHVAYYRRNRQRKFPKTISREQLAGAFVSWDNFNEFITSITNSLYSGNYIEEYQWTKDLIDGAYDNDKIITEKVDDVTDEASGKAFVKKCRELFLNFKFPSSKYNAYSKFSGAKGKITTWTDESRICVIITNKVLSTIDVDVLAQAFNMDKANFMGSVISIDEFKNNSIKAVICDESWLKIYDNLLKFEDFYNGSTMATNLWLHAWNTFAISPFANAVALVTEEPVPATNIAFNDESKTITGTEQEETLNLTLTPAEATTDVEFIIDDTSIAEVVKVDNKSCKVTSKGEGETTITAITDNNLSDEITITVTGE